MFLFSIKIKTKLFLIILPTSKNSTILSTNRCTSLSSTLGSLAPAGVKIPRGILPPTPVSLPPWEKQLAPWGQRYPGLGSLPPTPRKPDSLPPGGEDTPGYLAPPPRSACPRGRSSLPPGDKDTLAWAACPPPPENLTELNAEKFYFFKIKILIVETREN